MTVDSLLGFDVTTLTYPFVGIKGFSQNLLFFFVNLEQNY